MTIARHATGEDIPAILEMLAKFWAMTDYPAPFDDESSVKTLQLCASQGLLIVLDADGVAVGVAAGAAMPLIANHAYTIGAELAWWVEPEHRSAGNGRLLMDALENAARAAGVHFWTMMNLESVNPEIADKAYRSAGYKKTESTYLKVF